jgi:hypothetical protein
MLQATQVEVVGVLYEDLSVPLLCSVDEEQMMGQGMREGWNPSSFLGLSVDSSYRGGHEIMHVGPLAQSMCPISASS